MVRASRSIVDPVKAYAAPVTPSNVTNLGGRNPAGACTLASLPRPLVAHCGGSRQCSDPPAIKENPTFGRHRQHRRPDALTPLQDPIPLGPNVLCFEPH